VIVNNLLPGIARHGPGTRSSGRRQGPERVDGGGAEEARLSAIPAGRYGTIEEFGAMCAFLCSQHAGFMVGQNILLDGGQTNATI
jgi:3-oxoacyl-[acyl-carrier protein] reductase